MIFLRRQVPLLITLISGLMFAAQYYVPHPASEQMLTSVTKWLQIIGGFALVLGVSSLFHVHAIKIRRKEAGWGYSFVLYVSMLGTIAVGLWSNGKEAVDGTMTAFGWIYNFMMVRCRGRCCHSRVLHRLGCLPVVSREESRGGGAAFCGGDRHDGPRRSENIWLLSAATCLSGS
jgi:hypothetical protein